MSTSRRNFLKWSAAAGGALGLGALPDLAFGAQPVAAPRSPRRRRSGPRRRSTS